MARGLAPLDVESVPELARIVEEGRAGGQPRVLRRGKQDVAVLTPLRLRTARRDRRDKSEEDYQAFLSSAGSWKDEDIDALIRNIYESRRRSFRPPVDL